MSVTILYENNETLWGEETADSIKAGIEKMQKQFGQIVYSKTHPDGTKTVAFERGGHTTWATFIDNEAILEVEEDFA